MVKKYIKKPIPIEAIQWNGNNYDEIDTFSNGIAFIADGYLNVTTLEGIMKSPNKIGDYLVKGIKDEFYICEKTIFEESYELFSNDRQYFCSQMMY